MGKDVVCIYTIEYYLAIKKNEIMPFAATWLDLEIIILSKVSQKEKEKYHMISLICGIYNTAQINISMKQKQAHRYREEAYGCQRWGGVGGKNWEFGINRGKLLYIGWISNKVLYSQGTIFNIL